MKEYIVNAFTNSSIGGNGAGVVLDCEKISDSEMLKIASRVGLSETAFVFDSEKGDVKVRFFTPEDEVDLCGHATIATFSLLRDLKKIKIGNVKQETKAGILNVEVKEDEIFMEQANPKYYEVIEDNEIYLSLGLDENSSVEDVPVRIVSTGLKDILICVKDVNTLDNINPNYDMIKKISQKYAVVGYHVFALSDDENEVAYCRNFAPLYGINEECATGTSNGALASYLYKLGKLENKKLSNLIFKQGHAMKNPCEIKCRLEVKNDDILSCMVGGSAHLKK